MPTIGPNKTVRVPKEHHGAGRMTKLEASAAGAARVKGVRMGMKLSAFIKSRREQLDMSQSELAKAVKITRSHFISMIENERASFPVNRWKLFADALSIKRTEFLRRVIGELFPDFLGYLEFKEQRTPVPFGRAKAPKKRLPKEP
jgi:ribosome-binding protein aMBF1 (putative translation factor)